VSIYDRGTGNDAPAAPRARVPPLDGRVRLGILAAVTIALLTACAGGSSSGSGHGSAAPAGDAHATGSTTPAAAVSAKPVPPPTHTSCGSVVYIGDSTSDGEVLADYVPNPRKRLSAQLARVGVRTTYSEVSGARSIVEIWHGIPNAATVAREHVAEGFRGCWILALGTNEAADVAAGSKVGTATRIARMMSSIGHQPVMWVNAITLLGSGSWAEAGMRRWNRDLLSACHSHPLMRVFDWAAHAERKWFIPDAIHYSSSGYVARTRLIAKGLVKAFPRGEPPSASCLVR
jgi:hypothetical protein